MRGIIFTENNFLLTIDRIKKQTRRIINPQPDIIRSINKYLCGHPGYELSKKPYTPEFAHHFLMHENKFINPRYKVGETVYLKEPYAFAPLDPESKISHTGLTDYIYKYGNNFTRILWKNKLFMPKSAARYFIKITAVRAERLQDISDEDCIKEGILEEFPEAYGMDSNLKSYWRCPDGMSMEWFETPQQAYAFLFDTINGKGTWDLNPFVWVIDYSLIEN